MRLIFQHTYPKIMKNSFILILLSLLVFKAGAQDKKDTVKIKWGHSRILVFKDPFYAKEDSTKKQKGKFSKKEFVHWRGVDLGICMLSTIDNRFHVAPEEDTIKNMLLDLNYIKSISFAYNFWEQNFRLYKNYVNIVTGLGIEWASYNFKQNITLDPDATRIRASNTTVSPDSNPYLRNKLKITYAKLPLLLELNSNSENPNKSFHIAGGIELGYRLGSKSKQVFITPDNYKEKLKMRDDYNLNDMMLSTTVRIGYGSAFSFYANYGISQLFKYKKGPSIFPLTAGISVSF